MSKIKKALGLGDPVYTHDDHLDATIQRMQREHEEQLKRIEYDQQRRMMNSAQNHAGQQDKYRYGWQDPRRAMMENRATPSVQELYENVTRNNAISKEMMHRMNRTEKKVEMLTGFYTWITEVYPEIAAQHKAMRDLYEAANSGETQTPEASS